MTYKEAKQVQADNFDLLNPHMTASTPPHLVVGSIIAPEGTAILDLAAIYEKITDDHIPNEEQLLEMKLFNNNLIVYVVFKMNGSYWFQSLDTYKVAPVGVTDSGNKS